MTARSSPWSAALAGATAAAVSLGVTEAASGSSRRIPSLVVAVGDVLVDRAPFRLVEGAIALFGTADKTALVVGTVVLALGFGALLGRWGAGRPWLARAGFAAFGLVGVLAAGRVAGASEGLTAVTTAFAVGAGLLTLSLLRWAGAEAQLAEAATGQGFLGRRAFLGLAAGGLVVAAGSGVAGSRLRRRFNVEGARTAVRLPAAVRADPPIGTAALRGVDRLSPLVTPNDRFYRIDTAILVPQVMPEDWSLKVSGRVDRPFEVSYADLLGMPMVEEVVTLACVSNEVGGNLVGNAAWLGVPLGELLDRAGVQPDATQIVGRSVDGFTVGFPTEAASDGRPALVAVGMNGEPLPVVHGFPARLVVSGLYGYVSATKWLSEIELTRWDDFDAYWIPRGWAKEAPIKTQSRIDVPRSGRRVARGPVTVAGVAWAPHRGIARVEIRVDDGPWREAELSGETPVDSWRQWSYVWDAPVGSHTVHVRATDGDGNVQTAEHRPPAPDGATGHHSVAVRVG